MLIKQQRGLKVAIMDGGNGENHGAYIRWYENGQKATEGPSEGVYEMMPGHTGMTMDKEQPKAHSKRDNEIPTGYIGQRMGNRFRHGLSTGGGSLTILNFS